MKSIRIFTLAALASLTMLLPETSYSQEEKPDTILHITTPSKVVVTENASGSKVEVRSLTDDEELIASVFTGYSSESSVSSKML